MYVQHKWIFIAEIQLDQILAYDTLLNRDR